MHLRVSVAFPGHKIPFFWALLRETTRCSGTGSPSSNQLSLSSWPSDLWKVGQWCELSDQVILLCFPLMQFTGGGGHSFKLSNAIFCFFVQLVRILLLLPKFWRNLRCPKFIQSPLYFHRALCDLMLGMLGQLGGVTYYSWSTGGGWFAYSLISSHAGGLCRLLSHHTRVLRFLLQLLCSQLCFYKFKLVY